MGRFRGGGIAGSRPRAPGNEQAGYLQVKTNAMKKQARHIAWPVEKPGGPSGIRTQNPGIMSPLR